MKQRAKQVALSALATVAAAASLTVATVPQASAINEVNCGFSDFLQVRWHAPVDGDIDTCLANAGEYNFNAERWLTRISTGNNVVQWYGDGRWQPDGWIAKWTIFTFPNHPGGVNMSKVRIR